MTDKIAAAIEPQTLEEAEAVEAFLRGYRAARDEDEDEPQTIDAECRITADIHSDEELSDSECNRVRFQAACAFVVMQGKALEADLEEILDAVEAAYVTLNQEEFDE